MRQTRSGRLAQYNSILIAAIVLVGMAYVFASNHGASQTYELSQYSAELKDLQYQHELLTVAATNLQSIESLAAASTQMNFVKPDSQQVYYLRADKVVAANR